MLAELLVLAAAWQTGRPLPLARSEVAGADLARACVGRGRLTSRETARSSARVDAYDPRARRLDALPDLPVGVNHAMAAAGERTALRRRRLRRRTVGASSSTAGRWRRLPSLPLSASAAGAAVIGNTALRRRRCRPGGVVATRRSRTTSARRRWRTLPGPAPREHLGVTALRGRLYAVAGRVERTNGSRSCSGGRRGRASVATARSACQSRGAAPERSVATAWSSRRVRSRAAGTSAAVYALHGRALNRWGRLPDLPTTAPRSRRRSAIGATVHVIGGGPQPGLSVSAANESPEPSRLSRARR